MSARRINEIDHDSHFGKRRYARPLLLLILVALVIVAILVSKRSRHSHDEGISVLALPFSIAPESVDKEYLAIGMSATLALQLDEIPNLDVNSPTLWSFIDPDSSDRRLAARLGADVILRGELAENNGAIEVRIRFDGPDSVRSSETVAISGSLDSLIDVQTDLLPAVARHLGIETQAKDLDRVKRSLARSSKAYLDYLRGVTYLADLAQPRSPRFAVELLSRAVQLDPLFTLAHVELGRALWRQGFTGNRDGTADYHRALQAVDSAESRVRHLHSAATTRILAQHSLHPSLSCAEAAENWGLEQDTTARQLQDLAASYLQVGRLQAAEDCLAAAVDLVPESWRTWSRWGSFLWKTGRLDEASDAYARAQEFAPAPGLGPRQVLVLLSLQMGDLSTALETFASMGAEPIDADMAHGLALASSSSGNFSEAERLARLAISFSTERPRYYETLGDILVQLGRTEEAEVEYGRALEKVTDDSTSMSGAVGGQLWHLFLAAKAGNCDLALPAATTQQRHSPPGAESSHYLARIFAVCGKHDLALEALATAIDLGFPTVEILSDRLFERTGLQDDIQALLEVSTVDAEAD